MVSSSRYKRSAKNAIWAIVDQALFGLSNFVLNLLLARWLAPSDYGAFTLAFALFLLVGVLHSAIFIEPMLVFGGDRFKSEFHHYMATIIAAHWLITGAVALCACVLVAAIAALDVFATPILPVCVAFVSAPFILF